MEKLKDKLVLLVDDDERNSYALAQYLETLELRITAAEDGKKALERLEVGLRPDIILLDMLMPVMDGYQVLGVLKKSEELKHIPVIAVTARAMVGDKEKCLAAGAWDYISKPIDVKLLTDKLIKWIP